MRKALIIGIDYYDSASCLHGCVNDAREVSTILGRNADGSVNFHCKLLTASSSADTINRHFLKDSIQELFSDNAEIALFYFAGHGHIEESGGYLLSSEIDRGDDGVSLNDILNYANASSARNKIIILDSCHSGLVGTPSAGNLASLTEGLTVLTASTKDQYATEEEGSGVFTKLLVDALNGSAANLLGDITPGSVYAHIDQSLGAWEQRPVFKTNVKNFVSLRKVTPAIPIDHLRMLKDLFPTKSYEFQLNPTFEPERTGHDDELPEPVEENTKIFSILQKFNRLNLLVPVDAPHMWHAAMQSKSCKLTQLGEHYRKLSEKDRI